VAILDFCLFHLLIQDRDAISHHFATREAGHACPWSQGMKARPADAEASLDFRNLPQYHTSLKLFDERSIGGF